MHLAVGGGQSKVPRCLNKICRVVPTTLWAPRKIDLATPVVQSWDLGATKLKRDDSSRIAKPRPTISKTGKEEGLLNQTQHNRSLGRLPSSARADSSKTQEEQGGAQTLRCDPDFQNADPAKAS